MTHRSRFYPYFFRYSWGDTMISAQVVWAKALPVLQEEMTPTSYKTWVKDIMPISIEGNTLILMAQNELYLTTLRQFYSNIVTECVNKANGTNYAVSFIVKEEAEAAVSVPVQGAQGEGVFFGVSRSTPSIRSSRANRTVLHTPLPSQSRTIPLPRTTRSISTAGRVSGRRISSTR